METVATSSPTPRHLQELPVEGVSVNQLTKDIRIRNLRYLHDEIRGYWALLFDKDEKLVDFIAYPTFLPTKDEQAAIRTEPTFPFPDEAAALAKESSQVYIQAVKQWIIQHVKQDDLLLVLSCPENQAHHFDALPKLLEACRCPALTEMVFSTYNFDDLISIYVTLNATMAEVQLPEEVKEEVRAEQKRKEEQKKQLEAAAEKVEGAAPTAARAGQKSTSDSSGGSGKK